VCVTDHYDDRVVIADAGGRIFSERSQPDKWSNLPGWRHARTDDQKLGKTSAKPAADIGESTPTEIGHRKHPGETR